MRPDEYLRHDALGLAELVAGGEVTPAELLTVAREQTAKVNPQLNAVVAMLDAQADQQVADLNERAPDDARPFAGVPFLLKDLHQEYAGVPSSSGSRALADRPAEVNATVVDRWLGAGLVVFGRTNTPEFGAKGVTEPDLFGPARNPWDTSRTPGGSSGGSAAAVAGGIVPVAGASDGGGSIRIPSACCGLFGLKASRGLIPSGPLSGEGFHGAGTEGVISRSVRDTAAMLDVLAGTGPNAPYLAARPTGRYLDEVGRAPGTLRIGVHTRSVIPPGPSPDALAAVEDARGLLTELGHQVEDAPLDVDDAALAEDFLLPWFVRVAAEVAEIEETWSGKDGFELDTRLMAALGRATSATQHERALARWHDHTRTLSAYHDRYDLLLTPTLSREPVPIGALATPAFERVGARVVLALHLGALLPRIGVVKNAVNRNLGWVPYTQLANLTGRPAMNTPLHWTAGGLPLGVQFVAPLGGEGTLLRLAGQLEQARPWFSRRPAAFS